MKPINIYERKQLYTYIVEYTLLIFMYKLIIIAICKGHHTVFLTAHQDSMPAVKIQHREKDLKGYSSLQLSFLSYLEPSSRAINICHFIQQYIIILFCLICA